ncbi:MAG TPA: radical SAM family heme chaperone HemW [bacterium]
MSSIAALYVHIPFCHSICPFCAFAVHQHRADLRQGYMDALRQEIAQVSAEHAASVDIASIYVGGGTPSTLSGDEVAALMRTLRGAFSVRADAEVALELNPEDATAKYLAALRKAGVTRISLGIQSLDDATLRALGRTHTAEQARAALDATKTSEIRNVNADLMFGAPGMSGEAFRRDVDAMIERRLPHLSLYGLDVEEGTPFGRDAKVRTWAADHRELQAELYLWAHDRLTAAGYRHYEVSNFCLPGHEGRQNLLVWSGEGYLGLGQGAHSYVAGARWHNARHLREYEREISAGRLPIAFHEQLSPAQQANESLMLALRQDTGLDIPVWERQHQLAWGVSRQRIAEQLARTGHADYDGARLRLTAAGLLVADEITEQLMVG